MDEGNVNIERSNENSNGLCNGRSKCSTEPPQKIVLTGKDDSFLHEIHSKDVTIVSSLLSQNNQNLDASNMVKFKPIVNFDWVPKYYHGNLVVGHNNQIHLAYVLKGKTGGIVRVTNRKTSQRTLLKNFTGAVVDISFATSDRIILGIVDAVGNLFVYEFLEEADQKLVEKLLVNCVRPESWPVTNYHRLVWCSFIGDDDKSQVSSSSPQNDDSAEIPLDDSLMLILTHNEMAELWHVDLVNRIHGDNQIEPSDTKSGYYLINSHTKPIIDAAFSPDATAVATASLDGEVKFFQVNMSDANIPKCLHHWVPHNGRPISFIYFLDDHKNKNPDVQLWKFVLTGCDENSEIKIWNCQTWYCLQTITFVGPQTTSLDGLLDKDLSGKGDNDDRVKSERVNKSVGHFKSCLKAKIDRSSMFLILSDINRQVVYIMYIYKDLEMTEAYVSYIAEFLLSHSCLNFDILDVNIRNKKPKMRVHELVNIEGDDKEGERSLTPRNKDTQSDEDDENDNDVTNGADGDKSTLGQSINIQLFSIHTKALQEITIRYSTQPTSFPSPTSTSAKETFPSTSSTSGMRDLLSDMSLDQSQGSNGPLLTPTNTFSPSLQQQQQQLQQLHEQQQLLQQQHNLSTQHNHLMTSSMTSSSSSQPPILLGPEVFLSPRQPEVQTQSLTTTPTTDNDFNAGTTLGSHMNNSANADVLVKVIKHNGGSLSTSLLQPTLSSSVDYYQPTYINDDDEDDDDEVDEEEERGDVEGADRDRPDGGTRARVAGSGRTSGNGSDRFFDRGGDGGGDGNSSSATSSASQEVTEILEGAVGVGAIDTINQGKTTDDEDVDDGDVEDDEDDDAFIPQINLLQMSQQQQQQQQSSSSLYMEQQQQIAHHLPNLSLMNVPPSSHQPISSSSSSTTTQQHHQYMLSTSLFEVDPNLPCSTIYHNSYHSNQPSKLQKWASADDGVKNMDEHSATSATDKDRKSSDAAVSSKTTYINEFTDGIRPVINNQLSRLTDLPVNMGPSSQDLMDQLLSQDQEIKYLSTKLQLQTTQVDASLRSLAHEMENISKNMQSLSASLQREDDNRKDALNECKLEEMFREFMLKYERSQTEHHTHFSNALQANLDGQLEKIVSNEIKKSILPKLEQSLDAMKDKVAQDVSQKLSNIDTTIKNNLSKMLKSKPTLDSIGQSISSELKSNLRSIQQDIVVPSMEKGCQNIMQQLNNTFQIGTQQYLQGLESHLSQTRKSLENHKHPAVIQMKMASEALILNEAQQRQAQTHLTTVVQSLQGQIAHLQQATSALVAAGSAGKGAQDEAKLQAKLNELQNSLVTQVRAIVSEELVSLLKDQQVAIKDQFDAALRSVTPAPSNSSHHSDHLSIKTQILAFLKAAKFNNAFQTALSATDLSLVEYTCENVDSSVIFGDTCLLNQSVLLSLIQQLSADLNTKPELKYRFLDEAIVFLDPNDPVTKEHLDVVLNQLRSNLLEFLERKSGGTVANQMNKLLRRTMLVLRTN